MTRVDSNHFYDVRAQYRPAENISERWATITGVEEGVQKRAAVVARLASEKIKGEFGAPTKEVQRTWRSSLFTAGPKPSGAA